MIDRRAATLLDELRTLRAAGRLEARHLRDSIELLSTASEPLSRTHYTPGHITASCFVVDPAAGRLLLHHHLRLGRWLQMGGHLDAGETPAAAALREAGEESGLERLEFLLPGVFDVDLHFIPAGKGEPDHWHFDVRYLACAPDPEPIVLNLAESKELLWIPLDDAPKLMNERGSSRAIRKIRRHLAGNHR